MVLYPYRSAIALDPNGGKAANTTGQIYATEDTAFATPLSAVDANGVAVALTTNADGILPTFYVADHTAVNWKSGTWVFPFVTSEPVPGPPGAPGPAVQSASLVGDKLKFIREDGVATEEITLPTGPGGSDSGVAGYITTPGTQTAAALSSTTASSIETPGNVVNDAVNAVVSAEVGPVAASIPLEVAARSLLGPNASFFGDSITWYGEGYGYWAAVLSGGAFRPAHVASNPGYTSTSLLPVIDAQIIQASPKPSWCLILCGANDAQSSVALATFASNVQQMVGMLRAAGITPVLGTVPPNNNDTYDNFVRLYNAWLMRYCEVERVPMVDFYTLVLDHTTGNWKATWDNGDGLHPSNIANKAMGKAVVDTLKPFAIPRPYLLQPYPGTPNIQGNSNFMVDTNNDGLADNVSGAAADATLAYSRLDDTRGFKWQRLTLTSPAAAKQIQGKAATATAGEFAVGDTIRFAARVRTGQDGGQTRLSVTCYTAGYASVTLNRIVTAPVTNGMTRMIEDGVASTELIVPANTEIVTWLYNVGPVSGTYDVAQPTFLNLTKLGIV